MVQARVFSLDSCVPTLVLPLNLESHRSGWTHTLSTPVAQSRATAIVDHRISACGIPCCARSGRRLPCACSPLRRSSWCLAWCAYFTGSCARMHWPCRGQLALACFAQLASRIDCARCSGFVPPHWLPLSVAVVQRSSLLWERACISLSVCACAFLWFALEPWWLFGLGLLALHSQFAWCGVHCPIVPRLPTYWLMVVAVFFFLALSIWVAPAYVPEALCWFVPTAVTLRVSGLV